MPQTAFQVLEDHLHAADVSHRQTEVQPSPGN